MDQPVVRHRLAKCAAMLESQTAWVESFVFQLSRMSKTDADKELGGLTALCKANAGTVLDECARCAVLLFGGNGYTRSGQGEIAESTLSHRRNNAPMLFIQRAVRGPCCHYQVDANELSRDLSRGPRRKNTWRE